MDKRRKSNTISKRQKKAELTEQKVNLVMWRQICEVFPECRKKGKRDATAH